MSAGRTSRENSARSLPTWKIYLCPVPAFKRTIRYRKGELEGRVRYCVFREIGYFIGIEFQPGNKWSQRLFRPMHLLDPRRLVARAATKARSQQSTPSVQ